MGWGIPRERFSRTYIEDGQIQVTSLIIPKVNLADAQISEKDLKIRDERWDYIRRLVQKENIPHIFNKKMRGKLMTELHQPNPGSYVIRISVQISF
ncbi:hypothetical protein [Paenibacillus brasilensis]|uniref:hypothetical protein n=1 Tax=Paenibacillus brasilensis TaxID=128574 RepID=UPI0012669007|nr:hypothetical protein [Paenibacillus brasilensis]